MVWRHDTQVQTDFNPLLFVGWLVIARNFTDGSNLSNLAELAKYLWKWFTLLCVAEGFEQFFLAGHIYCQAPHSSS